MKRETVISTGFIPAGREKFYVSVPFETPPGVARLEVRYDYSDAIGSDPLLTGGNTVDIGLFDWRGDEFLHAGFRGWSGSERRELYLTPTDATPGYMPGPLTSGTRNVCVGFYKVAPNGCHYTVDITYEFGDAAVTDFPPMLTLDSPNHHPEPHADGWYRGELHCHTVHSDGDSTASEVIAEAERLGLDFLAVTDHNNVTHLMEIAALGVQKIILIPGYEVTTYRGHWNVWAPDTWVDFRITSPEDMQQALDFARQHVVAASCNHPRPFGPPWEYPDVTGYHCVEVWNGPWRLFNTAALEFWETRLRAGQRLAAVGGSDMHRLKTEAHAHIATPTTWVFCPGEPTAAGLLAGLKAGHVFLSDSLDGARLYLTSGDAMMGDAVRRVDSLDTRIRAVGGKGLELQVIGASGILHSQRLDEDDATLTVAVSSPDTPYVRAQLVEPDADELIVRALTNPIYLD